MKVFLMLLLLQTARAEKAPRVIDLGRGDLNAKFRQPRLRVIEDPQKKKEMLRELYAARLKELETRWLVELKEPQP